MIRFSSWLSPVVTGAILSLPVSAQDATPFPTTPWVALRTITARGGTADYASDEILEHAETRFLKDDIRAQMVEVARQRVAQDNSDAAGAATISNEDSAQFRSRWKVEFEKIKNDFLKSQFEKALKAWTWGALGTLYFDYKKQVLGDLEVDRQLGERVRSQVEEFCTSQLLSQLTTHKLYQETNSGPAIADLAVHSPLVWQPTWKVILGIHTTRNDPTYSTKTGIPHLCSARTQDRSYAYSRNSNEPNFETFVLNRSEMESLFLIERIRAKLFPFEESLPGEREARTLEKLWRKWLEQEKKKAKEAERDALIHDVLLEKYNDYIRPSELFGFFKGTLARYEEWKRSKPNATLADDNSYWKENAEDVTQLNPIRVDIAKVIVNPKGVRSIYDPVTSEKMTSIIQKHLLLPLDFIAEAKLKSDEKNAELIAAGKEAGYPPHLYLQNMLGEIMTKASQTSKDIMNGRLVDIAMGFIDYENDVDFRGAMQEVIAETKQFLDRAKSQQWSDYGVFSKELKVFFKLPDEAALSADMDLSPSKVLETPGEAKRKLIALMQQFAAWEILESIKNLTWKHGVQDIIGPFLNSALNKSEGPSTLPLDCANSAYLKKCFLLTDPKSTGVSVEVLTGVALPPTESSFLAGFAFKDLPYSAKNLVGRVGYITTMREESPVAELWVITAAAPVALKDFGAEGVQESARTAITKSRYQKHMVRARQELLDFFVDPQFDVPGAPPAAIQVFKRPNQTMNREQTFEFLLKGF